MKRLIVLFLLLIVLPYSAESYTVILKNGKVLKGKLLSETDELLVFKDEVGLQYSLKKSLVDLEKTKQANVPLTPPVPAPEEIPPAVSQQQEHVPPPEEAIAPESSSYFTSLNEGTTKLENAFEEVGSYLDAMMTAWEVNASTGRDPIAALREFKTTKGPGLTVSIDALIQVLEKFKTQLNDPPVQFTSAFESFNSSVGDLTKYYDAVRQYEGKPAIRVFRSRLSTDQKSIQKKIDQLKAIKP
jgi:hypothetical protein